MVFVTSYYRIRFGRIEHVSARLVRQGRLGANPRAVQALDAAAGIA